MTTISSQTILRSRNNAGKTLSTLLLRYPRWIHAELLTHRVLSRNSASSRAIPVKKLIQDVIDNPAVPIFWSKNEPGMQGFEECDEFVEICKHNLGYWDHEGDTVDRETAWLMARDEAVNWATRFSNAGYHKQLVNRLLEPFSHITVLVSGTEWDNLLELRDHEDAEPHIQMLAKEIKKSLEEEPQYLEDGDAHLPFITKEESETIEDVDQVILSVARCASTSYKTVDGFDMSLEKARKIYDKLIISKPRHSSPAEHIAAADSKSVMNPILHGNFKGFVQYRKLLEGFDA